MATSNEITERRMVPRWRPFKEALDTGELSPSVVASATRVDVRPFLAEKEVAWQENRSLPFAVELVSASVVLGASAMAADAAEFVLESNDQVSITAQELARKLEMDFRASSRVAWWLEKTTSMSTDNRGMSSTNRLIAVPPFMAKCGVSKIAGVLSSKSRTISM